MEPSRYWGALRRSWKLILAFAVVGALTGYFLSSTQQAQYRSSASMFFQVSGADNAGSLLQGSNFAQSQVRSYAVLATQPIVLDPVIKELGLTQSPASLARQIEVSIPLDTVVLQVQATAGDPERAREIADAVATTLGETVESLSKQSSKSSEASVNAQLVGAAVAPRVPVSPNPRKDAVLGLLAGIAIGAAVAVVRELLNNRVSSEETLAAITDLPLLGKVPLVGSVRPQSQPVPAVNRAQVEGYRRAAANLDFINHSGQVRALVVTSPNAGEGKTSLAANLAFVLSESRRVLLVDADLRSPSVATRLGLEPEVGLTTILTGKATLGEAVQTAGRRFDVLTSGPTPPNPIPMIGSDGFARLIAQARGEYDLVILDAAPLLPVTDSALLAKVTDGALLAVSCTKTTRTHLSRAIEHLRLAGAPVHGVVLTMTPMGHAGGGYYGQYGQASSAAPDDALNRT